MSGSEESVNHYRIGGIEKICQLSTEGMLREATAALWRMTMLQSDICKQVIGKLEQFAQGRSRRVLPSHVAEVGMPPQEFPHLAIQGCQPRTACPYY